MRILLLFLFLAPVTAYVPRQHRIVGGSVTTIDRYPEMAVLKSAWNFVNYYHSCGGSILNQRNILTAAHCFDYDRLASQWRVRVGSSFAHSGGAVHNVAQVIKHPGYDYGFDYDCAILRTSTPIIYLASTVQPGYIAGANYVLGDNLVVWAAGWGETEHGTVSEQLRHVQLLTINQKQCEDIYGIITANMLCTGWLGTGGRDQCGGDSGGPVYYNGVIVGICSFGSVNCGSPNFPGVNARVSRFAPWISANAN